jgi:hypothetical protein
MALKSKKKCLKVKLLHGRDIQVVGRGQEGGGVCVDAGGHCLLGVCVGVWWGGGGAGVTPQWSIPRVVVVRFTAQEQEEVPQGG